MTIPPSRQNKAMKPPAAASGGRSAYDLILPLPIEGQAFNGGPVSPPPFTQGRLWCGAKPHNTHYTERCIEVRPLSVRQIGIYRLLFLITLKKPIAKKTALTNKNDNNTMS